MIQPAPEVRLAAIATELNTEHAACERALRTTLAHAMRVGELLHEAKAICRHGEWLPWLRTHFAASERTARNYMALAAARAPLAEIGNVADLPVRDALKRLAAPYQAAATRQDRAERDAVAAAEWAARRPGLTDACGPRCAGWTRWGMEAGACPHVLPLEKIGGATFLPAEGPGRTVWLLANARQKQVFGYCGHLGCWEHMWSPDGYCDHHDGVELAGDETV